MPRAPRAPDRHLTVTLADAIKIGLLSALVAFIGWGTVQGAMMSHPTLDVRDQCSLEEFQKAVDYYVVDGSLHAIQQLEYLRRTCAEPR